MRTISLLGMLLLLTRTPGIPPGVPSPLPREAGVDLCMEWADLTLDLYLHNCADLATAPARDLCLREAGAVRRHADRACRAQMLASGHPDGGVTLELVDHAPEVGTGLDVTIPVEADLRLIRLVDLSRGIRISIALPAPGAAGEGEVMVESIVP